MLALLAALIAPAHATGLPPWEEVVVVDADCAPAAAVDGELWVTFARKIGTCAPPGPEGSSCSEWVDAVLPGRKLVVRRPDCGEPLPGRFVQDGRCGELPRWRWSGRLDAGHRLEIGRDFGPTLVGVDVGGTPGTEACPAESPRNGAVVTEVRTSTSSAPQWIAFPAEGYAVVEEGEAARLVWTPGPRLQHWVLGNEDLALKSEPLDPEEARAVLAGALPEPTGLAVRHRIVASREWFEGWKQRGVPRCERILEQDLEQRLRAAEGDALGPPMVGTIRLREPSLAEHCFPEENGG